jgi:hypothetical protein
MEVVLCGTSIDVKTRNMEQGGAGQWGAHGAGDCMDTDMHPCMQRSQGEYSGAHGKRWTDELQYNEMINRMFSLWSVGDSFQLVRVLCNSPSSRHRLPVWPRGFVFSCGSAAGARPLARCCSSTGHRAIADRGRAGVSWWRTERINSMTCSRLDGAAACVPGRRVRAAMLRPNSTRLMFSQICMGQSRWRQDKDLFVRGPRRC